MLRASRYFGFAGVSRKGNKVSSNYATHTALKCSFPFRINGDV